MKIYTEVTYKWENDSLKQESSKSFDYSGEVSLCKGIGVGGGGGGGGNPLDNLAGAVTEGISNTAEAVTDTTEIIKDPAGTIEAGPGGTLGDAVNTVYGGTTKDLMDQAQGKTNEGPAVVAATEEPEDYIAQEGTGTVAMGGRKETRARSMTNTGSTGATRLTSSMPVT
mgnify:FL=1